MLAEHSYLIWFRPMNDVTLNNPLVGGWRMGHSWSTGSFLVAGNQEANTVGWKSFGNNWFDKKSVATPLVKDTWSFLALTFDGRTKKEPVLEVLKIK